MLLCRAGISRTGEMGYGELRPGARIGGRAFRVSQARGAPHDRPPALFAQQPKTQKVIQPFACRFVVNRLLLQARQNLT
jgi:hypothetical protein